MLQYASDQTLHLSMRDRLLQAKGSREVAAGEKKVHAEFKVAGKEIEKPRRNKKAANTNIAASGVPRI